MKVYELKVGDKIELRDDLEDGEDFNGLSYDEVLPKEGCVLRINYRDLTIRTREKWWYAVEMIAKVNDKRVKFVNGFEYTIEEEDVMIDPKSLVQSGDFVVCDCQGKERVYLAVQRGSKIALVQYPVGWDYLDDDFKVVIKKIFRYNEGNFRLGGDEFNGDFVESCGKFIYDSERDSVKEVTMEELERIYGRKVKIVKG